MRFLTVPILLLITCGSNSQSWQSIDKQNSYQTNPYFQFSINPYTNNIWMVGYGNTGLNQLAVIENDGDILKFPQTMSPTFLWGPDLSMAFTPNHIYYAHDNYGLYSFDNYLPQMKLSFTDYNGKLKTDTDTVYVLKVEGNNLLYKHTQSSTISLNWGVIDVVVKNNFLFASIGPPIYFTDQSIPTYEYLYNDPEYLYVAHNEMKFTRNTDTLFVAGKLGISKVFNYDVFDTITPNNTVNMPSPNVLEMEWDMDDNLWAVFGDASDDAFAIAKLENDTWTNYFDANNSPINFAQFRGLEIDTLSNVWVADRDALHTLLTPNSPAWLNVDKLELNNSFEVYPNPSNGNITIATKEIQGVSRIEIVDLMGRTVLSQVFQPKIAVNLPSGNYFLQLKSDEGLLGVRKIVIE